MRGESYIKLYRKVVEWEHYKDGNTMRVFMHLLILASHERQNMCGVMLKRGQCLTSSRKLQEDLGLCAQYVTDSIRKLKDSGDILTESASGGIRGTVFTIVNYDKYQDSDRKQRKDRGFNGFEEAKDKGW